MMVRVGWLVRMCIAAIRECMLRLAMTLGCLLDVQNERMASVCRSRVERKTGRIGMCTSPGVAVG